MKIAVISDIHGNMEAFNAVLADIKSENCDSIFCLGDLALAGPEPDKVIDKIRKMVVNEEVILIQGNTDFMLANPEANTVEKIRKASSVMANAYIHDEKELSDVDKEFLKNIDVNKEITIAGVKILLVHGSPRRNDENILANLPIEQVEEMIKGTDAHLIFCGHTHVPCGYQTNTNQTVVNVGSVGRPFSEEPLSCYALLEIDENNSTFSLHHKHVEYDYKTAAEKMRKRKFEGSDKMAQMLECASSRYPQ